MITSATIYRLPSADLTAAQIEENLAGAVFLACSPNQEKSVGFVPPRGEENGALVESVNSQWLMKLMTETRTVPCSAITLKAKERIEHIKGTTGRIPGKKETREIKDDIKLELLPTAFSKVSAVWIWIDPVAKLLVIDVATQAKADAVVTQLVKSIQGLAVTLLETKVSPTAAMSEWLIKQEPPAGFSVDRECELKAADESKAVVRFTRHPLDTDEVREHVQSGKLPTRMALTWDSRMSFVLTDNMILKKIKFLDIVFEGNKDGKDDAFDADVLITTSELRKMIPDLICALGGGVTT